MARGSHTRYQGYTLHRAIDEVFGVVPLWPWSSISAIMCGGLIGAAVATALQARGAAPPPALRWAACAGYGILIAALLTVLPRAFRLFVLRGSLAQRPPDDGGDRPWWPLRLLAAALRGTPATRRTHQDFTAAVDRAGPEARSILAHRFWPAVLAAVMAPVLGLLSAWEAGKQVEAIPGETAGDVLMRFVPQVCPPMVATISASLVLMACLAMLDQWTKGLLQRWVATIRLTDGETKTVQDLLDHHVPRKAPQGEGEPTQAKDVHRAVDAGQPSDTPPLSVDDLERLGAAFSNRGRGE
jgi:hypothetical protein